MGTFQTYAAHLQVKRVILLLLLPSHITRPAHAPIPDLILSRISTKIPRISLIFWKMGDITANQSLWKPINSDSTLSRVLDPTGPNSVSRHRTGSGGESARNAECRENPFWSHGMQQDLYRRWIIQERRSQPYQ